MAPALILFGVSCPEPCAIPKAELASIEREAIEALSLRGSAVRPALPADPRPTGESASIDLVDEAKAREVDRVVALDLEPPLEDGGRTLWITHFLRGTAGPWAVSRIACRAGDGGAFECPGLGAAVVLGLKPRKAEDVDMVSALRARAPKVTRCVRAEDEVPANERIFGKVEIDLKVLPNGKVEVVAIAPAVAAKSSLGACLANVMRAIDVGPFDGEPIELRVPLDL